MHYFYLIKKGWQLKMKKIANITPLIFLQIFFIILPLFFLFYHFYDKNSFFPITSWLIQNNFFNILIYTYKTAIIVSFITLIISYTIAYSILQQNKTVRALSLIALLIPSVCSFLIHMLSIMNLFYNNNNSILSYFLFLFNKKNILYSNTLIYIGYIYCYLPYMFIPIYNSLSKFNLSLLRASCDLGATFWQTIFKILIPNTKNAIMSGFFLVFISSSGEFVINEILGGDKKMQISSIISYTLLSGGMTNYSIIMIFYFIISLILSLPILYCIINFIILYIKKT